MSGVTGLEVGTPPRHFDTLQPGQIAALNRAVRAVAIPVISIHLSRLGPDIGVCLDTGHTALGGFWHRFVEISGTRLMHVHAHDNHGYGDDHLPPGDGLINWGEVRRSLDAAGYGGWIMLELHCPHTDPGAFFKRAVTQALDRLSG